MNSGRESKECLILPARKGYQVQLAAGAFDEEGNLCFRESERVRFRMEGPAELLAADAGELAGKDDISVHCVFG